MVEAPRGLSEHAINYSESHHGHRPPYFDELGIPAGWVVNGKLPSHVWDNIKTDAIPLMPGGINPFNEIKAISLLNEHKRRYFGEVTLLLIPDEETEEGMSANFVLVSDLEREPEELLKESNDAFNHSFNSKRNEVKGYYSRLSDMKRTAYMAVTGQRDTK